MGKKSPLVVIIPMNFNGATNMYSGKPILWYCLNSLKGLRYDNYRVLVSDGSTDNSVQYIRRHFPGVQLAVNAKIKGYTRPANFAIKIALRRYNPDYIVMIDNDVIIREKTWLARMVALAEADESVGIVGSKIIFPDGKLQNAGTPSGTPLARNRARELSGSDAYNNRLYSDIEEVDVVSSARFLLKRRLVDKVLFDENLYMGNEDTDYCLMARRAGFKIIYDGELSAIHIGRIGGTTYTATRTKGDPDRGYPIVMTNDAYFAFKTYTGLQRMEAIALLIMRSFLGIGIDPMRPSSVRLKNRAWWRFRVCLGAIRRGYKLYRHQMTRGEAYGL